MKTKGNIKTCLDEVVKLMGWDNVDLKIDYIVMPNEGEPDESIDPSSAYRLPLTFYYKKISSLKRQLKDFGLKKFVTQKLRFRGRDDVRKDLPALLEGAWQLEKELMPDSFAIFTEVQDLNSKDIPEIPKFLGIDGAYAEAYRFEVTSSSDEKDNYCIVFNLAKEKVTMRFGIPPPDSIDEYKQIAKKLSKIAHKYGFTPSYKTGSNI
jgi:hypothetical protein